MAEAIYNEIDGADDKRHLAATVQEIYEWLANGSLTGNETAAELAVEWMEYNEA